MQVLSRETWEEGQTHFKPLFPELSAIKCRQCWTALIRFELLQHAQKRLTSNALACNACCHHGCRERSIQWTVTLYRLDAYLHHISISLTSLGYMQDSLLEGKASVRDAATRRGIYGPFAHQIGEVDRPSWNAIVTVRLDKVRAMTLFWWSTSSLNIIQAAFSCTVCKKALYWHASLQLLVSK